MHALQPELDRLETLRRAILGRIAGVVVAAAGVEGVAAHLLLRARPALAADLPYLAPLALLGLAVAAVLATFGTWAYRRAFKERIIRPLVRRAGEALTYTPDAGMAEDEYRSSLLFDGDGPLGRWHAEDLIGGPVHGVEIRFGAVRALSHVVRYTRTGRTCESRTIFRGVLFVADHPCAAQSPVVVLPRRGRWRRFLAPRLPHPLAATGDATFDRRFTVYSGSAAAVATTLTPARRQRLLTLACRGEQVRASFVGRQVFVAVTLPRRFLEPPLLGSVAGVDPERHLADLRRFTELPAELRLGAPAAVKRAA